MAITNQYNVRVVEGTAAELDADTTIYPDNVLLYATDTGAFKKANGADAYSALAAPNQAAAQADSTAGTVADIVADFNSLLAKLRAAGLMAS